MQQELEPEVMEAIPLQDAVSVSDFLEKAEEPLDEFVTPEECQYGFYWSAELSSCDKCYEECFRCDGPEEADCLECVMPKYMGANSCIESYSVKILKGTNLKAPTTDEVFRPYLMVQLFGEDTKISRDVQPLTAPSPMR